MINRIGPMASPFLNYVRRREHLWTLKMLAPGRLAPFLSPDVADRIWSLNGDGLLEQEYRNQVQASKKRLHRSTDKRNRKALEENEVWNLLVLNPRRELPDQPSRCRLSRRSGLGLARRLSLWSVRHLHRALSRFS